MASKLCSLQKVHSLFPDSPTNRLQCKEHICGCLHFVSSPTLTPVQTYKIPPVITLEICPSSALNTCKNHQGPIEYQNDNPNPKGEQKGLTANVALTKVP